ncbi:unnamed protein product [Macrosiphum euphorbiae]|uniref:HAT C-terminal dimerisation domain-containing protein n=1 Tax=Macrosiphum euphorbiae TaxID=13131 RepID=A0AAV0Y8M7_9HEMI|nr:unnamed protein product [Macrosiphum euphorbiae]
MKLTSDQKFIESIEVIYTLYGSLLDNFKEQALSWYDLWKNKEVEPTMKLIDILDYAKYYPVVCQAIQIAITLPVTSCSVEPSFSTLRRLKTWIRNRMGNERLSSLGRLSLLFE